MTTHRLISTDTCDSPNEHQSYACDVDEEACTHSIELRLVTGKLPVTRKDPLLLLRQNLCVDIRSRRERRGSL